MQHSPIDKFLSERLEKKIKEIPAGLDAKDFQQKKSNLETEFSPEHWLPNAARRASQLKLSSHPSKFTHPNAIASNVIATNPYKPDGYLRFGNVETELDVLGNAAAMDVWKFLTLLLDDGQTVLAHLEKRSDDIVEAFKGVQSMTFEALRDGFLSIKTIDEKMKTSGALKQVYFPLDETGHHYHLLSTVANSGLIFTLKKRIDAMKFSENTKIARENKRANVYDENGFDELYDLTVIGYGGTKPQNISVLNSQSGGKAYLLFSAPPILNTDLHFPNRDFFSQSLSIISCKTILKDFDANLKRENKHNSLHKVRIRRDECLKDIIDVIHRKMISLRALSIKQFRPDSSLLPPWQKIWLCEQYLEERNQDDWLNTLSSEIAAWIRHAYKNTVKDPVVLGKAEDDFIEELVNQHKEIFR